MATAWQVKLSNEDHQLPPPPPPPNSKGQTKLIFKQTGKVLEIII